MPTMHTLDRLIDPSHRNITTVFTTAIRVAEGTYDAGTVRVALTTSHDKSRKRFETRLNREVLTDSGFITRSIRMFQPSADAGITLATEPTARFNANKARAMHTDVLASLRHHVVATRGDVAVELLALLDAAEAREEAVAEAAIG